jgi:CDP-ribitol ribitolphosphotransferase
MRWLRQTRAFVFIRRLLRFCLLRVFFPAVYRVGCLRRVDPRLIYFVSTTYSEPPDNFRPLTERLEREGYRCVFFGKAEEGRFRQCLCLFLFFLSYARARALFLTEVCPLADSCRPRNGTDIIQLWHGCGALKKSGDSTAAARWGSDPATFRWFPCHRFYTYACVSSPEVIPHYAEVFRCDPSILQPWGMPRTDFYFRPGVTEQCRRRVLEAFPEIGARKILLYAPTFRGDDLRLARHDDALDYDAMALALGGSCALLLKPHPCAHGRIPAPQPAPFAFDAAALPIEVLLCACDLVISDYSSLINEYSLLGRPMLFYAYDLEEYEAARGFYYPYTQFVPGDLARDTGGVIEGVLRNLFEGGFDAERVRVFRQKFMCACDGHSTERILRNALGV